ncbi:MAG: phosphoribosylformylglycinamidine synthase subunit PurQ, partial [Proteobacteria bacterium]|nr:phosphoribosylformylglycinamidine synthase subunit PurQ [Pseudomonadota bacterium]
MSARVLVLTGYGLNCDHETAHAFTLAGAEARRVHIKSLVTREVPLSDFDILAFGGGFSWGDDHGAGVLEAVKISSAL